MWIRYQCGFLAGTPSSGWRLWAVVDSTPEVKWAYQKTRDVIDTVETWGEMDEEIAYGCQAGRLDWLLYILFLPGGLVFHPPCGPLAEVLPSAVGALLPRAGRMSLRSPNEPAPGPTSQYGASR